MASHGITQTMTFECSSKNPSYFFVTKNEETGENRSYIYFTYFTECGNPTDSTGVYEAAFFIANCALSFLLNSVHLFLIFTNKELRSVCNVFICNMAVADLVYGSMGPVLALIRLREDWSIGDAMCHLTFFIQAVCGCVLGWSIAAVSIDRYMIIVHPMKARAMRITTQRFVVIIATIWSVALVFMSPLAVFFRMVKLSMDCHICTLFRPTGYGSYPSYLLALDITVVGFTLPVILMMWCYIKCIRQIQAVCKSPVTDKMYFVGSHSFVLDGKRRRMMRDRKVMRTFMVLLAIFLVAWTPLIVVLFLIARDNSGGVTTSKLFVWAMGVAQMNSVVNPLAYGFSLRNVRKSLNQRLHNLLCCNV